MGYLQILNLPPQLPFQSCQFRISLIISICIAVKIGFAQPPLDLVRTYDFGYQGTERFNDIFHLQNGGYYVCGTSDQRALLVRLEDDGDTLWTAMFGSRTLNTVIETDRGDALTAGIIEGSFGALMVSREGERIWQREYEEGNCNAAIELKSGEFVLAGYSGDQGYITMVNEDGEPIWAGFYGNGEDDYQIFSMRETEGGVVTVGDVSRSIGWMQKVDFEGNVIWSRTYEDRFYRHYTSVISNGNEGFAISGSHEGYWDWGVEIPVFELTQVNAQGEVVARTDFPIDELIYEKSNALCRLSNSDFGLVGFGTNYAQNRENYLVAMRVSRQGEIIWRCLFNDLERNYRANQGNTLTSIIALPGDQMVVCGGVLSPENGHGYDCVVIRLEPDPMQPFIFYHIPEDTLLTILTEMEIDFMVRARNREGVEMDYEWLVFENVISTDTSVTIPFDDPGETPVICRVSDDDWATQVTWHVTVTDLYISAFSPDTLNLSLRRSDSVNFSLDTVRTVEGIGDVEYLWLKSRVDGMDEVDSAGTESRATISFMQSGNYAVEGLAYRGESSDAVTWNVSVRGVVWSFAPEDLALEVLPDSLIRFEVIPSNPEDSSLSARWFVDDELAAEDTTSLDWGFFYPVHSVHNIYCVLSDSIEADTVSWTVTVRDLGVKDKRDAYPTRSAAILSVSPNPFNSTLTIRYSSPINREATSISIHDISGREVFSAVTAPSVTGINNKTVKHVGLTAERTLIWNASNTPAGVYFVRLQSGAEVTTKKVVLMR